jgi:hypothetical protein
MLGRLRLPSRRLAEEARRAFSRRLSSAPRDDGFTEALPRRDVIAPLFCAGVYGFTWIMADEGRVQSLADNVDVNTDPNAWPTPNQVFHHLWPFIAGTFGMLFESAACKFTQTSDMDWLCKQALQDDTKAAVALCLLTAPAEHSPAFVRAVFEHGTMPRIKEIIQIYKTLRRAEHDELLVNAAVLTAKAAALPDLQSDGLGLADFVWMVPDDKAYLYAPYGLEGIGWLWQKDKKTLLTSGGIARVAELMDGPMLPIPRPTKAESSMANMELAERLMGRFVEDRAELLHIARATEAELVRLVNASGEPLVPRLLTPHTPPAPTLKVLIRANSSGHADPCPLARLRHSVQRHTRCTQAPLRLARPSGRKQAYTAVNQSSTWPTGSRASSCSRFALPSRHWRRTRACQ